MKNFMTTFGKVFLLVLVFTIGSGLASAQSRYKHVPRVKVDVKHQSTSNTHKQPTGKVEFEAVNMPNATLENTIVAPVTMEETAVASVSDEPVVANHNVKPITAPQPVKQMKEKRKGDLNLFGDHFNIKSKLLKVKSVDKTQGTVGIILLIAFYVLSILFTVLCIVFLLDPNPGSFTLFLVFLILAIVFAIAGSIMLTLLKLGVI